MRQISIDAARAFHSGRNFKRSNSQVYMGELFLHGNKIAKYSNRCLFITNAGWSSNVTKERLNSLCNVAIYQKNFEWFLNDEVWDGRWVRVCKDYNQFLADLGWDYKCGFYVHPTGENETELSSPLEIVQKYYGANS